jgi:transcriptional regulator with XRE-family HTH domain
MGHARRRPKRLAEKLLQIRTALGLSQSEMVEQLGVEVSYRNISKYERDKSEPPINVLLAYARVANIALESIVDDDIDLETAL